MKRMRSAVLAALALGAMCSAVHAQEAPETAITLKFGDAAPALKVGKWVKGEPVAAFEPGKVYVIECWATWCVPCVAAIPHVTELQHKYKDKVVVIGQNMWERNEAAVAPFLTKMGDKMDYRVVMDDKSTEPEGAMAKTWMQAAGRDGIPCSFIVDGAGKVAWIGHPMAMAPVLEQVLAGTFDVKAAAEKDAKAMEEQKKMMVIQQKLGAAMRAGKIDDALKIADEIAANPEMAPQATTLKFRILLQSKRYDDAYAMSDKVYDAIKDDPQALNEIAWTVATGQGIEKRDLKFAQKLADRAVEKTERKDAAILDSLARILFDQGQVDKAVEVQTEAVSKADEKMKVELEESLTKYKAAKK